MSRSTPSSPSARARRLGGGDERHRTRAWGRAGRGETRTNPQADGLVTQERLGRRWGCQEPGSTFERGIPSPGGRVHRGNAPDCARDHPYGRGQPSTRRSIVARLSERDWAARLGERQGLGARPASADLPCDFAVRGPSPHLATGTEPPRLTGPAAGGCGWRSQSTTWVPLLFHRALRRSRADPARQSRAPRGVGRSCGQAGSRPRRFPDPRPPDAVEHLG